MYISEKEILRMKLDTAYYIIVMKGVLIVEEFLRQKAIEDYFKYLDK